MIVQAIMNWARDVIATLLEIVNPTLSTSADGLAGGLDSFFAAVGSSLSIVDPFIPVQSIGIAIAQGAAVIGFLIILWGARFVVSVATGGGGSV